ncbi:MAG: response regulator transcription factor [Candidatus Marinimicrobia bacterium]|nr:response regulator transcription factor [Candidatus Neomarinimicrobiota bacterium]MCF7828107.1 response regulator transcription factor [Candidatus Neomarinimicrobiota bacterium]MCF7879718.1 response regulator transcription factor [Candidatus Neomarinimicrobiota bacterium]
MTQPEPRQSVNILVADDHPLFRAGVVTELKKNPDFTIVAEASDGQQAFDLIVEHEPDVAVLDVKMPVLTGLEVARKLQEKDVTTEVILLTMLTEQKIFLKALGYGVQGYVLKDAAVQNISTAVKRVAGGCYYLSPEMTGVLVKKSPEPATTDTPDEIQSLTPAERTVLSHVAELESNQEIAETLFISVRTVENHKVNINRKLGLQGRNTLLKYAIAHRSYL